MMPIAAQLIRTTNTGGEANGKINFATELTPLSLHYQKIGSYLASRSFFPSDIQYNLTISEEKKFVWFRVAKVGTRTILDIFNQANVTLTAEHPYDSYYPVNLYEEYFRFAFVRNPWDRIVSCWQNKVIDRNLLAAYVELQEFENYVDYVARDVNLESGNRHLRLQSRLIDMNHIDYLGRFETFEENLKEVMDIIGITASIKKKNASKRKEDYREYYSSRTKDKVAKLYKRDINLFNYEF